MQAVEGEDKAEHRLAWQLPGGQLAEGRVGQSPPGEVTAGPFDRMLRGVVAVEAGARERRGQGPSVRSTLAAAASAESSKTSPSAPCL